MKIIIASTIVPFIEGGGTFIVDWLENKLIEYGHRCEVLKIPFYSHPSFLQKQMLAIKLMDIREHGDLLITIRTPSYLLNHPNKIVWFIHHYRPVYDLWGTPLGLPESKEYIDLRESVIAADNIGLGEAKKIFTNSPVVSGRLKKFNNIDSEVLFPPLYNSKNYFCNDYGDYLFYPSRIVGGKRQQLVIESMKYTKTDVKLIVAGLTETKEWADYLKKIISKNGLENKVKLIDSWISLEEKIELFSNSLGCTYVPVDEDSYGYVSLESYHSKKPIITCSDSGGTLEVVEDGVTGYIVDPKPEAIAESMDLLYSNKNKAEKMGNAGFDKINAMNITWDNVIKKMTE